MSKFDITKKQREQADSIFAKNAKVEKLFINKKGEFFTEEHFAKSSVKEGSDYQTIYPTDRVAESQSFDIDKLKEMGEQLKPYLIALDGKSIKAIAKMLEIDFKANEKLSVIAETVFLKLTEKED